LSSIAALLVPAIFLSYSVILFRFLYSPQLSHSVDLTMFADAALGFICVGSHTLPTSDCTIPACSVAIVRILFSIVQRILSTSGDLKLFVQ